MKKVKEKSEGIEVISFDVSSLSEEELHDLFSDLPIASLQHWLGYYVGREQYEVCKVIKEYIDQKEVLE